MSTETIKAVIFDVDGTAIANYPKAVPSQRVVEAIKKAQSNGLKLSCATGRNYVIAKRIIDALGLEDPCIVSAGTQIVNPEDDSELWTAHMNVETCAYALSILSPYKLKVIIDGENHETAKTADMIEPKAVRLLDVQHVNINDLPHILERLAEDDSVAAIPVHSSDPELYFLHITDKLATKEHAVNELLKMLHIDKPAAAGVGDGLNDFELFKSVGTKIAMGNSVGELKQAADEVVATVEDDGLAQYLESLSR